MLLCVALEHYSIAALILLARFSTVQKITHPSMFSVIHINELIVSC